MPSFRVAYERERAELVAERDALQSQLKRLATDNAALEQELRTEIEHRAGALAAARRAADAAEDRLGVLEEQLQAGADPTDVIDSTLEAAALTLQKLGRTVPIDGDQQQTLVRLYEQGTALVRELGTVHAVDGSFFDDAGIERSGRIVWIGRVAALGVADGVGGVLTRVPAVGLQLVDAGAAKQARQLASGEELSAVPVQLFDPSGTVDHSKSTRTWIDLANAGGVIAWVILGLGALGLLIMLERALSLWLVSGRARAVLAQTATMVPASPAELATRLAAERGALARVMHAVLAEPDRSRERLEDVATEAIYREMPRIERLVPLLGVIAAIAPLLGLLGTVVGMISTFEVITEHGTGDPKLLSSGISVALITTELGLIVAVPALLGHHAIGRWSDRVLASLQAGSLALINRLDRQRDHLAADEAAVVECGESAVATEPAESAATPEPGVQAPTEREDE